MDRATGKWVSHSGLYMMPGLPLDQSLLPQAADYPGYERIGWQINENGKWVLFGMERVLTMDDDKMRLYEVWALNAPYGCRDHGGYHQSASRADHHAKGRRRA